ncbi:MAG: hypothetical protein ACXIU2_18725, partial [Cyclobacteriaceae bacterium]
AAWRVFLQYHSTSFFTPLWRVAFQFGVIDAIMASISQLPNLPISPLPKNTLYRVISLLKLKKHRIPELLAIKV